MSYPDVTLLRDICAVLGVTEHELLTASEDTERRSADRLAAKYLRLTRNYRAALYILFGAVLLGCAIGNPGGAGDLELVLECPGGGGAGRLPHPGAGPGDHESQNGGGSSGIWPPPPSWCGWSSCF